MAQFIPRAAFPAQLSLPRSYFLGHHASGLSKMKTMLSSIDLIIECRDYRVPLTSRNPLFEQSLAGRERLVIYTKRDLGSKDRPSDKKVRTIACPGRPIESLRLYTDQRTAERRHYQAMARATYYPLYRSQVEKRHEDGPRFRQRACLASSKSPRIPNARSWYAQCW